MIQHRSTETVFSMEKMGQDFIEIQRRYDVIEKCFSPVYIHPEKQIKFTKADPSRTFINTKLFRLFLLIVFLTPVHVLIFPQVSLGITPVETVNVMAPLWVSNDSEMEIFDNLLDEAVKIGVTAVSVDVWWGSVEADGDDKFDWSYYDIIFNKIREKGLKIVPIMSFHQCGGGPGDDCNILLPRWIWTHFIEYGLSPADLKFESETGNVLEDTIAPWATKNAAVIAEYMEFMNEFEERYTGIAGDFDEINISLGPTGELRYPSYNNSDYWSYPCRGHFQAYSDFARKDFREWALGEFRGLEKLSERWAVMLSNPNEIRVPGGHLPPNSGCLRARAFVDQNDYQDTAYGMDFITWYNNSLVCHGKRMLLAADKAFNGPMKSIPLGIKIPGIHWQMKCTATPRIAEIAAGLVDTKSNLDTSAAARDDAYGYKKILDMIAEVKREIKREIILHFTALEMDNDANCNIGTSLAESLVFWISDSARDRQITLKGENALSYIGDPEPEGSPDDRSWSRIRNAFRWASYNGFTFLRLSNHRQEPGPGPWDFDKKHLENFIRDFTSAESR